MVRDLPPKSILVGNPSRIAGYCGTESTRVDQFQIPLTTGVTKTLVRGVSIHKLPNVVDSRGSLSFGEANAQIPFEIQRYFLVFGVPSSEVRGEHAHKTLHQFLLCVSGSCHVVADDGKSRQEFTLAHPTIGLYLPPLIWAVQYRYSKDAVLLVLTSAPYDAGDYIRDYSEFLRAVAK